MYGFGPASLDDILPWGSQAEAIAFLSSIPPSGVLPFGIPGGYYADGNFTDGEIYFALGEDILPFENLEGEFRGRIQLTARTSEEQPVIPEPASMLLLGSGLLGMVGIRRKKCMN